MLFRVRKPVINNKLQGTVVTYLRCGGIANNNNQIANMPIGLTKLRKVYCWVYKWIFFYIGEYLAKLQARSWGPRDGSCKLKSCQLPRNSAETSCTTKQIEVMKLEGYTRPICRPNKHVHSTVTRSSRFYCPIGLGVKQTDDGPVVDITCIPTTCCGEIF